MTATQPKPVGLNHVGVTVENLERSIEFWRDAVGLDLVGSGEVAYPHLDEIIGLGPTRIGWAELLIPGGGLLELFQYVQPAGRNLTDQTSNDTGTVHICLEFTDVEDAIERVRAGGGRLRSDHAVRIPFGDWEGWLSAYAVTPDGVVLELVQRPPDAAAGVPGAASKNRRQAE